jgi:hypothetical protein
MYENAVKKEPNNEEWLSHLFMSYVRLGNYKRQQQVQSFFKQNSTPEPVQPDCAQWAIVYFVLILTKLDLATFWVIFSQTHLVTLSRTSKARPKLKSDCHLYNHH